MKKILAAALGVALLGMASSSFAASSNWANFNIRVVIASGANLIEVVDSTIPWAAMNYNDIVFSNFPNPGVNDFDGQPRCSVRNVGSNQIGLEVRCHIDNETTPGFDQMTLATTGINDVAENVGTLGAVFTAGNATDNGAGAPFYMLLEGDVAIEDLLASTSTFVAAAGDNVLGIDAHGGPKGHSIDPLQTRNLRFRFHAPSSLSAALQNDAQILYIDMRIVGTL